MSKHTYEDLRITDELEAIRDGISSHLMSGDPDRGLWIHRSVFERWQRQITRALLRLGIAEENENEEGVATRCYASEEPCNHEEASILASEEALDALRAKLTGDPTKVPYEGPYTDGDTVENMSGIWEVVDGRWVLQEPRQRYMDPRYASPGSADNSWLETGSDESPEPRVRDTVEKSMLNTEQAFAPRTSEAEKELQDAYRYKESKYGRGPEERHSGHS